jgi:protein-tyrosine phosphatase
MISKGKTLILFVCLGNICRSPTAEGVMRSLVTRAGLQNRVIVDSAGTHDYQVGAAPDPRAMAAARRRGYDLRTLRARQICAEDFVRSDLILAMDFNNLEVLHRLCPPEHQSKIQLLMTYAPARGAAIVHDPYCRGAKDFDLVLDYVEDACRGLMTALVPESERALSVMPNRKSAVPARAVWGLR